MSIGPFKTNPDGSQIPLCTKNKRGKIKIDRGELIQLINAIGSKDPEWKAVIVGSKRALAGEFVKVSTQGTKLAFESEDGSCSFVFQPDHEKDAVVSLDKSSISVVGPTGEAIVLYLFASNGLAFDIDNILPDNINNGVRGESLLFTHFASVRYELETCAKQKLTTAILKEVNHFTWLVMASVTEAGHLSKSPYAVTSIRLDPKYNEDSNSCTIAGQVVITPYDRALVPYIYQEELRTALEGRMATVRGTHCSVTVQLAPEESADGLAFSLCVVKGIRACDPAITAANSELASKKMHELLLEAFPSEDGSAPTHIAHYNVPIDNRTSNYVYCIVLGLGVKRMTALLDIIKEKDVAVDQVQTTTLPGTESWMMRINFKNQQQ